MNNEFLIWSIEHNAWWRPHWDGYTLKLPEAGRYSRHEAEKIVRQANIVGFNECMIPLDSLQGGAPGA